MYASPYPCSSFSSSCINPLRAHPFTTLQVWLHRGAYGCADQLATGQTTTKLVQCHHPPSCRATLSSAIDPLHHTDTSITPCTESACSSTTALPHSSSLTAVSSLPRWVQKMNARGGLLHLSWRIRSLTLPAPTPQAKKRSAGQRQRLARRGQN